MSAEPITVFGVADGRCNVGGEVYGDAVDIAVEVKAAERHFSVEFVSVAESSPKYGVVVHDDTSDIYRRLMVEVGVLVC